jgi:hypothetical protein
MTQVPAPSGWYRPTPFSKGEGGVAAATVGVAALLGSSSGDGYLLLFVTLAAGLALAASVLRRLPEPVPWAYPLPLALLFLSEAVTVPPTEATLAGGFLAGLVVLGGVSLALPWEGPRGRSLSLLQFSLPAVSGALALTIALVLSFPTVDLAYLLLPLLGILGGFVLLLESGLGGPGPAPTGEEEAS